MSTFNAKKASEYYLERLRDYSFNAAGVSEVQVGKPRIRCSYCSVYSLEPKSNCDSCGAGLPLEESEAPKLFYNSAAIDWQGLMYAAYPGTSIPIKPSFTQTLLGGAMNAAVGMFPRIR